MPKFKTKKIEEIMQVSFEDTLNILYVKKEFCSDEISDYLYDETNIKISPRYIQLKLKELGMVRNKSEAYQLAIKKGRKNYDHLRKKTRSRDERKGINLKLRYKIMKRDNFRCVLCGKTADEERLEIDHIIPVVSGGTNEESNLRTLCRECNAGKMLLEEKHL